MTMKLRPAGHRILVKPDVVEDEVELAPGKKFKIVQDERLARHNQQLGTLVAVGPDAWAAFRKVDDSGKEVNGKPWAKPGDRVWYSKNAGKFIEHPETEEVFIVMNDEDISVILESEDSE